MSGTVKISGQQGIFLIVITIFSTMIIYLPAIIIEIAKQDGWLSVLVAALAGIVFGHATALLGERFPDQTIVQYAPTLLGRFLGKAMGLIFLLIYIIVNVSVVREFAEIFLSIFMPETPMYIFIASILIVSAYTVSQGLEVLARANTITFVVYVSIIVAIVSLNIPNMEASNLTPVLEYGVGRVLWSAIPAIEFFVEVQVLTMLAPYLVRPREVRAVAFWGVLLSGFLLLVLVLAGIAVLNCEASRTQFLALSLARRISIGGIIERVDPLVMLMWMGGLFIKSAVFYYVTAVGFAQLLNIKSYRSTIAPMGLVIAVAAVFLWPNAIELRYQLSHILPFAALCTILGTLLLLIAAWYKGKRGEK